MLLGNQRQAGGLGHLDDGRPAVAQEPVGGQYPGAHRARDLDLDDLAAGCVDERLHGAFAAVGHRHLDVGRVRPDPPQSGFQLARHFQRGQVFFEGVGGDDDLHWALLLTDARAPTANRR